MSVAFWVLGLPLALWVFICAVIWTWFFVSGHKDDHSGDMGLAVLAFPIIPFVLVFHKARELFSSKN